MNHTDSVHEGSDDAPDPSESGPVDRPLCSAFGATVRAHRTELGLTQQALADRTGLHRNYIGAIERGKKNVGLSNIRALALALGTDPATLLAETETRLGAAHERL